MTKHVRRSEPAVCAEVARLRAEKEAAEATNARFRKEWYETRDALHLLKAEADEAIAEKEAAEREAEKLRQLVIEAYDGEYPSNGWRHRAEQLNAWPGARKEASNE